MNIRKKSIKPLMRTLPEEHYVILAAMQEVALEDLIYQLEQIPLYLLLFPRDKVSELYHKVDEVPGVYLQKGKRAIEDRLGIKPVKKEYGVVPVMDDE